MASAIRSALGRLGSRAGITAPPRMPLLRQAALPNNEGQSCSNESLGMADKKKMLLMNGNSEMFVSTLSKWSRETLKTVLEADHYLYALYVSGLVIYGGHVMTKFWRRDIPPGLRSRVPDVNYDC